MVNKFCLFDHQESHRNSHTQPNFTSSRLYLKTNHKNNTQELYIQSCFIIKMYQFERNSRIYMKGKDGDSATSPTRNSSSRPSSRSPLQPINKSSSHHKSNQAIHTNGKDTNGTAHHSQTKSLKDTQQRAISSELGDLTAPGETKTKTQMARAFQESQELYKSADSKAGLQTVKTRRVLKKTTTITRGENEKVSFVNTLYFFFSFE